MSDKLVPGFTLQGASAFLAGLARGNAAASRGAFTPADARLASIPAATRGGLVAATGRPASNPAATRNAFTPAQVRQ
jgi:hypothetical protein